MSDLYNRIMALKVDSRQMLLDSCEDIADYVLENEYNEFLNEAYGETVEVAGYAYETANALKRLDEIAWREGFNNWLDDDETYIEVLGNNYKCEELEAALDALEGESDA